MNRTFAPTDRKEGNSSRVGRRVVLAVMVLLMIGVVGGAWYYWPDPHLAAVKQLQKELFGPAGRQLSPDERRQRFARLREEEKMLSDAQRQGLRAEGMRRRSADLSRYFRRSKEEKEQYLDNLIARQDRRREEWQANGGGPGLRGGRAANNTGTPQERDKRREDALDSLPATQRAEMTEFRREINTRRQELGLPTNGRR
jgi:hypothetical protein